MIRGAFLTGSRAYGTPGPDSDVDLAVLTDEATYQMLKTLADEEETLDDGEPRHPRIKSATECKGGPLRFGRLNLLCFTRGEEFYAWMHATSTLKGIAPVTRSQAIAEIRLQLAIGKCK